MWGYSILSFIFWLKIQGLPPYLIHTCGGFLNYKQHFSSLYKQTEVGCSLKNFFKKSPTQLSCPDTVSKYWYGKTSGHLEFLSWKLKLQLIQVLLYAPRNNVIWKLKKKKWREEPKIILILAILAMFTLAIGFW